MIETIDRLCVGGSMVSSAPVTAVFGDYKITGTTGSRNSARLTDEGGHWSTESFRFMVPVESLSGVPTVTIDDVLEIHVTNAGAPCDEAHEDVAENRVKMRVRAVNSAFAGITFDLIAASQS